MKEQLKQLWLRILNKQNKYLSSQNTCDLKVIRINDNQTYLSEELGIDDIRYKELKVLLYKEINSDNEVNVIAVFINISKECKHANELALCSYLLGMEIERLQNPVSFLGSFPFGKKKK